MLLITGLLYAGLSYYEKIKPDSAIRMINMDRPRGVIDINTAGAEEIERLPGIGPVLAEDIIAYREVTGGFKDPEELKKVKGIGDRKFEGMKGFIIIGE